VKSEVATIVVSRADRKSPIRRLSESVDVRAKVVDWRTHHITFVHNGVPVRGDRRANCCILANAVCSRLLRSRLPVLDQGDRSEDLFLVKEWSRLRAYYECVPKTRASRSR
jgi:hypothetical protein